MDDHSEDFNKDIEKLRKHQSELQNTMTEMEATLGINSRQMIQWNGSAIWKREKWTSLKLNSKTFLIKCFK